MNSRQNCDDSVVEEMQVHVNSFVALYGPENRRRILGLIHLLRRCLSRLPIRKGCTQRVRKGRGRGTDTRRRCLIRRVPTQGTHLSDNSTGA